jgi:redox-sensitive bicupin YhaK (pirin superfamily)
MSDVRLRPLHTLPSTELPWLRLRDHFVATVGARSGEGHPLGPLLVLADATFAPHSRFPLHPHREMEILSIVLDGELSHHGNQAHDSVVRARGAQLISARNGMVHAEGNDTDRSTRMLQLWFSPNSRGGEAAYFHRDLPPPGEGGRHLVAGDDAMPLRCDARVWWLDLRPGRETKLEVAAGRAGYLLALTGPVRAGEVTLATGEGAEVRSGELVLGAEGTASALWVDMAM